MNEEPRYKIQNIVSPSIFLLSRYYRGTAVVIYLFNAHYTNAYTVC